LQNSTQVFDNSTYLSGLAYMKYDTFDNKYYPKHGFYYSSDFQYYMSSTNYSKNFNPFSILKGDLGFANTLFKKATFKFQTEAGVKMGKESVSFFDFVLGGYGFTPVNNIKPFYGYDFLTLSGNSYIKSTLTLDYELFKNTMLT